MRFHPLGPHTLDPTCWSQEVPQFYSAGSKKSPFSGVHVITFVGSLSPKLSPFVGTNGKPTSAIHVVRAPPPPSDVARPGAAPTRGRPGAEQGSPWAGGAGVATTGDGVGPRNPLPVWCGYLSSWVRRIDFLRIMGRGCFLGGSQQPPIRRVVFYMQLTIPAMFAWGFRSKGQNFSKSPAMFDREHTCPRTHQ